LTPEDRGATEGRPRGGLRSITRLRAWRLALAGPLVYWFFPVFFVLLSTSPTVDPYGLLALMVVLIVSASWGFLLNDFFDRPSDAKSGRADEVHGHHLGKRVMGVLIFATALASWAVVFLIGGGDAFKVVLAVNYAVAILYSAPPAKLKVRRFWGFLADSLIERPLPILVLLSYMGYYTPLTFALPILAELTWSVFKHQAADLVGDARAGVDTLAVHLGSERSYRIVNLVLNPVSVLSLSSLVVLGWLGAEGLRPVLSVCLVLLAAGVIASLVAEKTGLFTVRFTPTDPPYVIYLNVFYRFVLLVAMGYGVAVFRPQYDVIVAVLAVTLGYQAFEYAGSARKLSGSPDVR
jgi:4-hydroxybenzoate polyprenyltransferase